MVKAEAEEPAEDGQVEAKVACMVPVGKQEAIVAAVVAAAVVAAAVSVLVAAMVAVPVVAIKEQATVALSR